MRGFLQSELLRHNPELPDPEYTARVLYAVGRELLQLRLTDPGATPERIRTFVRSLPVA